MNDSKTIVANATDRATDLTPSVIALAQVLKVAPKDFAHAYDNGNTAEYLAQVVAEFVKIDLYKEREQEKTK